MEERRSTPYLLPMTVIFAGTEKEMQEMILRFKRYLDRRKLILNVDKSKVMTFHKGGRVTKVNWKIANQTVESERIIISGQLSY